MLEMRHAVKETTSDELSENRSLGALLKLVSKEKSLLREPRRKRRKRRKPSAPQFGRMQSRPPSRKGKMVLAFDDEATFLRDGIRRVACRRCTSYAWTWPCPISF